MHQYGKVETVVFSPEQQTNRSYPRSASYKETHNKHVNTEFMSQ